jgi:SDR family mycofactocin-dependent oxidoreductase
MDGTPPEGRPVAFISGAGRGIGRACAVQLAADGADVIGFDICEQGFSTLEYDLATEDDLRHTAALVEGAGGSMLTARADVRDADAVAGVLEAGVARFGRLDFVAACAGILPACGPKSQSNQAWQDAIDVMLTGVFNTVRPAIEVLRGQGTGGSIAIVSSTAGLKGLTTPNGSPGSLGYVAAKHAVVGLMRGWANLLGPDRIRVNTVHPTGVNTHMVTNEAFVREFASTDRATRNMSNLLPVDLIEPSDVANAVAFLMSDKGRYVTGLTFAVDAGFSTRV